MKKSIITWHEYPKEKPTHYGEFLVIAGRKTIDKYVCCCNYTQSNHGNGDFFVCWDDVYEWAEMPEISKEN